MKPQRDLYENEWRVMNVVLCMKEKKKKLLFKTRNFPEKEIIRNPGELRAVF